MRVWIEYSGGHKHKIDGVFEVIAERHSAKFTGSGMAFSDPPIRDLEYKVPHNELAGFLTEVTDHWKKLKLHRIVVHDK